VRKYINYILPLLLLISSFLISSGHLAIGFLQVHSHQLKWTVLDYNNLTTGSDPFVAQQIVTSDYFEDAILHLVPDYQAMLREDLDDLAMGDNMFSRMDHSTFSLFTDHHELRICTDRHDVVIKDTMFWKKLISVDLVGYFELYELDGCLPIYHSKRQKFWASNRSIITGLAPRQFVLNKTKEILFAKMCVPAKSFIQEFELPYHRAQQSRVFQHLLMSLRWSSIRDLTMVPTMAHQLEMNYTDIIANGSFTYGHKEDSLYDVRILSDRLQREYDDIIYIGATESRP
jgi:hypothetical protein